MKSVVCLLTALAVGPAWGSSNDLPPSPTTAQAEAPNAAAPSTVNVVANADCGCVSAGTAVELEIDQLLNSSVQKRGDKFPIKLHAPIMRGETVLVPAGTIGIGEIVHADRSRGGGKPGELLLAARFLDFQGTQIPLRALKFGGQGKDRTNVALGTAIAVGVFAHFIRGNEIEIPAGTVVSAKLAQDFPASTSVVVEPSAATMQSLPTTAAPDESTHKE